MPRRPSGHHSADLRRAPVGRDRRAAYHEAAHAVIAHYLQYGPRPRSITIVPGEDSEGAVEW